MSEASEPTALPGRKEAGRNQAREEAPGLGGRALALGALVGTAGSLLWLVVAIARVFTDSWIAPIALSPESDAVLSMNLELTRQRAEIERAQAEMARIDAEIEAVDGGLTRLRALRDQSAAMFAYSAEASGAEEGASARTLEDLREASVILDRLITRQEAETERARTQLAAGLIERRQLEAQEQTLDSLRLQRVANSGATEEAEHRRRRAHTSAGEFRSTIGGDVPARMPEIVARNEADARLEVEVLRLEGERRGLVALHDVAEHSVDNLQAVMDQIELRPVYLATRHPMDVAFVPYQQLDGVHAGSNILRCQAGIFFCHEVGHVRSVLPGEVVTQDPWGELARGRYAVLDLDEAEAVQERILRVR